MYMYVSAHHDYVSVLILQELEALAAKLEEEKKSIEEAAKNLRLEKDTADQ